MTVYRRLVEVTAVLMIVLGLVMLIVTLARGFGVGVLLGVLFIAAGAGRLTLLRRRTSRSDRSDE